MKFLRFYLFGLTLALTACVQRTGHHYEQQILGDWKFVSRGKISKDRMGNNMLGPSNPVKDGEVKFLANNVCAFKLAYGYGNLYSPDYEGIPTHYKVADDSLRILDMDKKNWVLMKIRYMDKDTMILSVGDTAFLKAARMHHK